MFDVLLISLVFLILFGPVLLSLARRPRGEERDAIVLAEERSSAFRAERVQELKQARTPLAQDQSQLLT